MKELIEKYCYLVNITLVNVDEIEGEFIFTARIPAKKVFHAAFYKIVFMWVDTSTNIIQLSIDLSTPEEINNFCSFLDSITKKQTDNETIS